MQTLAQALAAAASKFKPALVPEQCTLQYNKKPVDLNAPFRLLNVPAGSKLEILIRSEWRTCITHLVLPYGSVPRLLLYLVHAREHECTAL